jgi:hypothetical protein
MPTFHDAFDGSLKIYRDDLKTSFGPVYTEDCQLFHISRKIPELSFGVPKDSSQDAKCLEFGPWPMPFIGHDCFAKDRSTNLLQTNFHFIKMPNFKVNKISLRSSVKFVT